MSLRSVITVMVSLAWLVAQTVAVASHCIVIGGTNGADLHSHAAAPDHVHGTVSAASVSHDHSGSHQHTHSVPAETPHGTDVPAPGNDCTGSGVALTLNVAGVAHGFDPRDVFDNTVDFPPNPETILLPTPPPNTVL